MYLRDAKICIDCEWVFSVIWGRCPKCNSEALVFAQAWITPMVERDSIQRLEQTDRALWLEQIR